MEKIKNRKEIIRKEIGKLGVNANSVWRQKSDYLRKLISIAREFGDEITLIPGFIPIKLSFERFIHIYIKHVEETKFADGAFKTRTFFDYEFDQIWILIKSILKQEKENIKDHFLEVSAAKVLKDKTKDYHRGFKSFPPIIFNGDSFAITIDTNGYIVKFHQL